MQYTIWLMTEDGLYEETRLKNFNSLNAAKVAARAIARRYYASIKQTYRECDYWLRIFEEPGGKKVAAYRPSRTGQVWTNYKS